MPEWKLSQKSFFSTDADNFSVLTIKKLVLDAYLYPAKSFCEKPTIIFEKKKLSFMFDRVLNVPMDT